MGPPSILTLFIVGTQNKSKLKGRIHRWGKKFWRVTNREKRNKKTFSPYTSSFSELLFCIFKERMHTLYHDSCKRSLYSFISHYLHHSPMWASVTKSNGKDSMKNFHWITIVKMLTKISKRINSSDRAQAHLIVSHLLWLRKCSPK